MQWTKPENELGFKWCGNNNITDRSSRLKWTLLKIFVIVANGNSKNVLCIKFESTAWCSLMENRRKKWWKNLIAAYFCLGYVHHSKWINLMNFISILRTSSLIVYAYSFQWSDDTLQHTGNQQCRILWWHFWQFEHEVNASTSATMYQRSIIGVEPSRWPNTIVRSLITHSYQWNWIPVMRLVDNFASIILLNGHHRNGNGYVISRKIPAACLFFISSAEINTHTLVCNGEKKESLEWMDREWA